MSRSNLIDNLDEVLMFICFIIAILCCIVSIGLLVTDLKITGMFGIIIFGLLIYSFNNLVHKSTYSILGMLGTFVGIVIGLYNFDSTKMDESVILLIDGLKTAFYTSIMGIVASLTHSVYHSCKAKQIEKEQDYTQIDNEIEVLNAIMQNTKFMVYEIKNLTLAINRDSEGSSVLGQIKLLRNDTSDGFNKLDKSLQKFTEEVSKSGTEAIVKALQEVINSFNEKITDQLGENFKSLGDAVEKLVVWQNEYKEYLESFKNNLELANQAVKSNTENVETLSNHIKDIKEHTSMLPENLQAVEKIITMQKEELQKLYDVLGSFAEMRDKAIQAIPEIKDQITKLTNEFSDAVTNSINKSEEQKQNIVNTFTKTSSELDNKLKDTFGQFATAVDATIKQTEEQKQNIVNTFTKTSSELESKLKDTFGQFATAVDTTVKQTEEHKRSLINSFADTSKNLENKMKDVFEGFAKSDESMHKEIQKVFEVMGSELATLSNYLVNDYKELDNAIKETIKSVKRT